MLSLAHPDRKLAKKGAGLARRLTFVMAMLLAMLTTASLTHAQSSVSGDQRFPTLDVRKLPPGTRVNVEATELQYDAATKVGVATGNVVLTYGPYLLVAPKVSYDQDDDVMRAEGEIRMREPNGNILTSELIELQNKFRDGFAEHLRLLLTNDATVSADFARRKDGDITIFTRAQYTRCKTCVLSNGTPLWNVNSRTATHVESKHRVYHRNTFFEVAGLPVFYTPYFSHPDGTLNNQTGLLTPTLSRSETGYGWGLTVPYIISLSPSYDITLSPMITTEHGVMPRAEWRQRLRSGQYSIEAAAINEEGTVDWRSYARGRGDFDLNSRWKWGFDGTTQSDNTFAREYNVDSQRIVTNQIFLTGIDDRNLFSARAMGFRNLVAQDDAELARSQADAQARALPYVEHSFIFDQPVFGGEAGLDTSFYRVTRKRFIDQTATPEELFQSTGQTRTTSTFHWKRRETNGFGIVATPFANLRGDLYQMDKLPDYSTPLTPTDLADGTTVTRFLPSAGIDLRWPLLGTGIGGSHVITPVAQITAATNETDREKIGNEDAVSVNFDVNSLFLSDRFTGLDRFEGGTRVNAGLVYDYLASRGGSLRAAVGQSYHIAGENSFDIGSGLTDSSSDLVAGLSLQPFRALRASYQLRLDNDDFSVHAQEANLQATINRLRVAGGYAQLEAEPGYGRADREQQVRADATATIYGPWNLFGGAHYDIERETMIRDYVGLGFDCDCFNAKLYYTEDYDTTTGEKKNRSLLFSFEIKTLGSSKTISPF